MRCQVFALSFPFRFSTCAGPKGTRVSCAPGEPTSEDSAPSAECKGWTSHLSAITLSLSLLLPLSLTLRLNATTTTKYVYGVHYHSSYFDTERKITLALRLLYSPFACSRLDPANDYLFATI